MNLNEELLPSVKGTLGVTWEHRDKDILDMIDEGIAFLESRASPLYFSFSDKNNVARSSRKLLKEYCRYAWAGTAAYFENDYRSDILNLQITAASLKGVVPNETKSL